MPRPKFERADPMAQTNSPAQQPGKVPYINATALGGALYEKNALPSSAFEDPVEKENEALRGENNELKERLEQFQAMLQSRSSNQLAVQGRAIVIEDFQLTPTSLIALQDVTPEAWERIGHILLHLEGSIQWLVGDWLVYGLDLQYGDIKKFAEYFERDEHTLYNYMNTSRSVESSLRNELLSYNHHVAVAKLTPNQQTRALAYAAQHRPSVANFRKWIDEQILGRKPALSNGDGPNPDEIARDVKKFMRLDPSTAKPEDRERFRATYEQIKAIARNWGIE